MKKPQHIYLIILLLSSYTEVLGQNTFRESSIASGIEYEHNGFMYIGGIAVCDFNGNGSEDIYITNGENTRNQLYLNNKDGTFSEVGQSSGVGDLLEGWGTVCSDIDNDGDLSGIFVGLNNGNGRGSIDLAWGSSTFNILPVSSP